MLLKFIDLAISDLFLKYPRHHSKTIKLQGEAPLIGLHIFGKVIALPFYASYKTLCCCY